MNGDSLHVVIVLMLRRCSGASDLSEGIGSVENTPLSALGSSVPRKGCVEAEERHIRLEGGWMGVGR